MQRAGALSTKMLPRCPRLRGVWPAARAVQRLARRCSACGHLKGFMRIPCSTGRLRTSPHSLTGLLAFAFSFSFAALFPKPSAARAPLRRCARLSGAPAPCRDESEVEGARRDMASRRAGARAVTMWHSVGGTRCLDNPFAYFRVETSFSWEHQAARPISSSSFLRSQPGEARQPLPRRKKREAVADS